MPTKSKLVYLSPAVQDMEEIVKYHIAEVGPTSAREIYLAMKDSVGKLQNFPLIGQAHPDPMLAAERYRKLVLTKPYVAIYKVIDGTVYVYRIVNGRTDYPKLFK